jgi:prepilin-type processing-associated H-X9-DG protein
MKRLSSKSIADKSNHGFTIVEVLVIVAVVGVLVLLRLTAMAQAQRGTKHAQCVSNLRQLNLATQLIANENNGRLPANVDQFGNSIGNWAWDLSWAIGDQIERCGPTWRTFYCPGTGPRISDSDNESMYEYYAAGFFHVVGYAFTFEGMHTLSSTNVNATLTPPRMTTAPGVSTWQLPSERVLVADATISLFGQNNESLRNTYNYTSIPGGAGVHLSPHLSGSIPQGGNLSMLDGHVEWRNFKDMHVRTTGSGTPVFWW